MFHFDPHYINDDELEGKKVRYPARNEIQIDLDSEAARAEFDDRMGLVWKTVTTAMRVEMLESKTPGHYHASIFFDHEFSPIEAIALQAILNSDWRREFFGFLRVMQGHPHPTCFIESPRRCLTTDADNDIIIPAGHSTANPE